MLVRQFVAHALYNKQSGYFATQDVIHALQTPFNFPTMWGKWDYDLQLAKAYQSKPRAWLTPSEIFAPHYSRAIAKYVLKQASDKGMVVHGNNNKKLVIYEIGGGSGTNALHVLNAIRDESPRVYKNLEYTLIEISPLMRNLQQARVCSVHENCRSVRADFLNWTELESRPCFVLALELLDNLPHDKVCYMPGTSPQHKGQVLETIVVDAEGGPAGGAEGDTEAPVRPIEVLRQLEDRLIQEVLNICPEFSNKIRAPFCRTHWFRQAFSYKKVVPEYRASFVPTGLAQFLKTLSRYFPEHKAILADYSRFPPIPMTEDLDQSLMAYHAPIVSSRDPMTGVHKDHNTYLLPAGTADIYFPVDFDALTKMYLSYCRKKPGKSVVHSQPDFLAEHLPKGAGCTASGYTPMLETFHNTKILLS